MEKEGKGQERPHLQRPQGMSPLKDPQTPRAPVREGWIHGKDFPSSLISLSRPSRSRRAPDPALGGGGGGDRGHPDLRGDRGHGGAAALRLVQEWQEAPGELHPHPGIPVRPWGRRWRLPVPGAEREQQRRVRGYPTPSVL